jgi:hypothetical protein
MSKTTLSPYPFLGREAPALTSSVVNDACWKFVAAMPHSLPGPVFNDLKPAVHAAILHYHAHLSTAPQPLQAQAGTRDALTPAARDVLAERARQISDEGWTPERDDQYVHGDLATAAGCYAMWTLAFPAGDPVHYWRWPKQWWKPSDDPRRNRVKAAALLLAEIERIDRAAIAAAKGN